MSLRHFGQRERHHLVDWVAVRRGDHGAGGDGRSLQLALPDHLPLPHPALLHDLPGRPLADASSNDCAQVNVNQ